jgi:hypothetical protein
MFRIPYCQASPHSVENAKAMHDSPACQERLAALAEHQAAP